MSIVLARLSKWPNWKFASVVLASISKAALANDFQAGKAEPIVGDQWTYDYVDLTTNTPSATTTYTVTESSNSDFTVSVSKLGQGPAALQTYDANWNLKQDIHWRDSPNDGLGYQFPLSVGKTWKINGTDKNLQNGSVFRHQGFSRVVDQESLEVPAGTFLTFRVVTDVKWFSVSGAGPGSGIHCESWYSPEINRVIKRVYTSKIGGHVQSNFSMVLTDNSPN